MLTAALFVIDDLRNDLNILLVQKQFSQLWDYYLAFKKDSNSCTDERPFLIHIK
jgi:hypothetical protein